MTANQNPEQLPRYEIEKLLLASGWLVQSFKQKNIAACLGVAIREYSTDTGPANYILFVDKKAVGVIEAKWEKGGLRYTTLKDIAPDHIANLLVRTHSAVKKQLH